MISMPSMIRRRSRLHRRAFTLVETMVAMPIVALLLLGTMELFINALRGAAKTQAAMSSAQEAANAVQHVVDSTREAQWFMLQDEGSSVANWQSAGTNYPLKGFIYPTQWPGQSNDTDFKTTFNGEAIYTAIELTMPATLTSADAGYTHANNAIAVEDSTGLQPYPQTGSTTLPFPPVNRNGNFASLLLVYRGNPDYTPNSSSGSCLWEYNFVDGTTTALCKTIATGAVNAVQFVRPFENGAALPNQVEVKIITGNYSPINNVQTNEATNGQFTTELTGKCVLMRNHATQSQTPSLGGAQSQNNPFQSN